MLADTSEKNANNAQEGQNIGSESATVDLGKENTRVGISGHANPGKGSKNEMNEKRKAQTAARDIMAKLAMQREETMDTEEAR
jgi:hypothetical protein